MFNQIKSLFSDSDTGMPATELMGADNKKLCAAVLMVNIIAADGKITPEEEARLLHVLETHYEMTAEEARSLAELAHIRKAESIDLFRFTSALKTQMSETERLGLIEDLWEMVYADGELHELEDNLVWRVAELLNVSSDRRMALKRLVRERLGS